MISTIGSVTMLPTTGTITSWNIQIPVDIYQVINSRSFVNEAKTWQTNQDKIQVSYDPVNL